MAEKKRHRKIRGETLVHTIRHKDGGTVPVSQFYRQKAIATFCSECMEWETDPKDCTSPLCPLFPYRAKSLHAVLPRKPGGGDTSGVSVAST